MKLLITVIMILSKSFAYAQENNLKSKTISALKSIETVKQLEEKVANKIEKIPSKNLTLKAVAVGMVLTDKRIDLQINNRSSINLDYKKESLIYSYQINF